MLVYAKRGGRLVGGGAREEGDLGLVEQTLSGGFKKIILNVFVLYVSVRVACS